MRSERHWSIYLPALSISILWAGILFWADRREPPLETLRLLALAVEAIAVPALYLWAFFRGRGAELLVSDEEIRVSTGGRYPVEMSGPLALVRNVQVAQSHLQKWVGAGQITVTLDAGERYVLDDMQVGGEVTTFIEHIRTQPAKADA
jgi:hypothetical protein